MHYHIYIGKYEQNNIQQPPLTQLTIYTQAQARNQEKKPIVLDPLTT